MIMKTISIRQTAGKWAMMCLLWAAMGADADAQHYSREMNPELLFDEAVRLMADHHYYAASENLKALDGVNLSPMHRMRTEGMLIVCDYYLDTPGMTERVDKYVERYPMALDVDRMLLLKANLLVRGGSYTEALHIYRSKADAIYKMYDPEREETQICQAISLINNEHIDEAEFVLNSLQNCKTHQMDMVYYSGYVKYVKGDYANALTDFEIVSHGSDYDKNMPVYMADCYLHLGQPQRSLSLLNNQLPMFSKQLSDIDQAYINEINRIRGEAHYDQGSYTKAIESLSQYVYNVEQPQRTALYKLGMSYMSIQEYAKAAPLFSRSASIDADEMAQSAWLNAGICYVYSQNKKQAQIAFQQASEMTANTSLQEEALYNYALTLHEGNTMGFGESVTVFEKFLNMFPQSQYAQSVGRHLSEVYFTTKNYQAALASINKIKNPSREILQAKQKVYYNLGVQEFISGNYGASDVYTAEAIKLGSNEAYYLKGESEYRQGKYPQAIEDLRKYVSVTSRTQPNYGQALYSLGYSYFKQKNYNQARQQFSSFINSPAASTDSRLKADALSRLADCMYVNRQYDEAYQTYQQVIETNVQMGDYALYQQAYIEGLRGNYAKKVELLAQMTGSYAESEYGADALYEQGRAYIQTGLKQEALQTFANLINRYPHSQKARSAGNEMGMIYFEAGNTEAALEAYDRVINSYPNTEEAQTALANLKDIYTDMGRVNEYAALAQKAGKGLSSEELDQMVSDAAVRAMTSGDYGKAYQYYNQLSQQTQQAEVQIAALEGGLRSSFAAKDYDATIATATQILQNSKSSPTLRGEALLYRAEAYLAKGMSQESVADLQALSNDNQTVYGAQANVRLSQYAYETEQYQAAEQQLMKFIDSGTTHQYWLARAFILLSDVYRKTNREVEAREYLLSLKSNYNENEEINRMIRERLK